MPRVMCGAVVGRVLLGVARELASLPSKDAGEARAVE